MSRINFFRLVCAAAFVMLAQPAYAQWSGAERDEFTRDCLPACRNNPNVSEAARPQCVAYCACVMEGAEREEPNYKLLNDDFLAGRNSDRVRRVQSVVPGCNSKAFR